MSDEKEMAAAGILLTQKLEAATEKQMQVVASSIEVLVTLSPEAALDCMSQLKEQITEEKMKEISSKEKEYAKQISESL